MTSNYPNSERIPQGEASSFQSSKQDHQNGGNGRHRQYRQPDENTGHSQQTQQSSSGDSSKQERPYKTQGNSNFSNSGNPKSGGNSGNNASQWQQGQSNNRANYQGGGFKDQYQQSNSSNPNNNSNRSSNNQEQFNRDTNKGERANAYAQQPYQQQQPDQLQMKGNPQNGNNPKPYSYQKKQPDQESGGNSYNQYNNGQNRPAKEGYNSYNSSNNYNSNSSNYNNRQEGYNSNTRYENNNNNNNNGYSGQGQNYKNQRNNNNSNNNYNNNNKQYQQQDRQSSRYNGGGGQKIFTEKPTEVSQQYVAVSSVIQKEKLEVANSGIEGKENLNPPQKDIIQQESLNSVPVIGVEEIAQNESQKNVQNSVNSEGGDLDEKAESKKSEITYEENPETQQKINRKGNAQQVFIKDVSNMQENLEIAQPNTKINENSQKKSEIEETQLQLQVEEQQVQQESENQQKNQNEQMQYEKEEEEKVNTSQVYHDEEAEIRDKQKELETALENLEYVQFESEWIVWMCFSPESNSQNHQDEHTFLLNNQPVINFDNLKKLCLLLQNSRFSNISQFFIFKYLKKLQFDPKQSSMRNVEAISFFKKGIKPIWEDEKNFDGVDLQTKFSGASPQELDEIYHYLLVKIFCEEFPFKSQLNGFRFADKGNSKKSGVRLELWFDKLSDSEFTSIKEYFTEMINIKWPNPILQWKTHK